MQDVTTTATLVEPARLGAEGSVTAMLSRAELEEALEADGEPVALWFDVERGDETARVTVELAAAEAEELLRRSSGDEVMVALDAAGVAELLEAPDVEAHGMREKIVLLGVVAATAAASTSVAQAKPVMDIGSGGGATVELTGAAAAAGPESPAATTGGAGIGAPAAAPDAFERAVTSQGGAAEPGGAVAAAGDESPAAATGGAALQTPGAAPYSDAIDRAVAAQAGAAVPDALERAVVSQAPAAPVGGAVAAAGGEAPATATGGPGVMTPASGAVAAAGTESPAQATGGADVSAPAIGGAVAAAGLDSPAEATGGAAPIPPPVTADDGGFELQLPTPAEGALIGGLALLITGAGVVAARGSRRRPATP